MNDPVVSRAVLNRLKAPSELALAQRIFDRVACAAEPFGGAAALAYDSKATALPRNASPAREAFLKAATLSAPGAKYAQASKECYRPSPLCLNEKAAAAARALRDLRCDFKRCSQLYVDGRLLPLPVFVAALELPQFEKIQGRSYPFTPELVDLRNEMVKEYLRIKRAIVLQPRGSSGRTLGGNGDGTSQRGSGRVTAEARDQWEAKLCQVVWQMALLHLTGVRVFSR